MILIGEFCWQEDLLEFYLFAADLLMVMVIFVNLLFRILPVLAISHLYKW